MFDRLVHFLVKVADFVAMTCSNTTLRATGAISPVERIFRLLVLVGHLIAAVLWWWLEPGGFPWEHPRFWSNRVLPVFALGWIVGSLISPVGWVMTQPTLCERR